MEQVHDLCNRECHRRIYSDLRNGLENGGSGWMIYTPVRYTRLVLTSGQGILEADGCFLHRYGTRI